MAKSFSVSTESVNLKDEAPPENIEASSEAVSDTLASVEGVDGNIPDEGVVLTEENSDKYNQMIELGIAYKTTTQTGAEVEHRVYRR